MAGPLAAVALYFGPRFGLVLGDDPQSPLGSMAAVLALMAIWWITEALPIAVTALVPLALYPLLKIPPGSEIARSYGHPLIFLFLGGFLIAIAIEDSGLHRRVALLIIAAVGDNPRRIVLGFMLATAGLSMWLSNTATTIMLLPIALSVIKQADQQPGEVVRKNHFSVALMLALAYSASIGGVATLIGTPPNVLFKAFYEKEYPAAAEITFPGWMVIALPFSLTFLVIAWLVLTRWLHPLGTQPFLGGKDVIRRQKIELGPMQPAEWRMLAIFVITALLWMLREPVPGKGWAPLLGAGAADAESFPAGVKWADDGTVAIVMAMLCFVVPSGNAKGNPLLDWSAATRLPWGILLLFGGGLALGSGMNTTGLDDYLGGQLAQVMRGLPEIGMMAAAATGMTFFTELTSNLASINMLLPVLAGMCKELAIDPRQIMIATTLASSCAFMLPVATAPNAIVYGSGRLRMTDMIKAGFWLNLIGIVLVVVFVQLLGG